MRVGSCSHRISRSCTLPLVLLQPDRDTETVFNVLDKIIIKPLGLRIIAIVQPFTREENSENAELYYNLNDVIRIKRLLFKTPIDIITGALSSLNRRKHSLSNSEYCYFLSSI